MHPTMTPEELAALALVRTILSWKTQKRLPGFNQVFDVITKAIPLAEDLERKHEQHIRVPYLNGERPCHLTKRYGSWYIVDDGDYEFELKILSNSYETMEEARSALIQAGGHLCEEDERKFQPPMKAVVGDFLRLDGGLQEVVSVDSDNREYHLANGGVVGDGEVSQEQVLLPSQV